MDVLMLTFGFLVIVAHNYIIAWIIGLIFKKLINFFTTIRGRLRDRQ